MVEGQLHVNNPTNSAMHYGQKVALGVLVPPDHLPVKNPYNYYEGQYLYNNLSHDAYVLQQTATPKRKGVPKIIKLIGGIAAAGALIFGGVKGIKALTKGIKTLISKFRH